MVFDTNDKTLIINLEPLLDLLDGSFQERIEQLVLLNSKVIGVIDNELVGINNSSLNKLYYKFGKYAPDTQLHHLSLLLPPNTYIPDKSKDSYEGVLRIPFITHIEDTLKVEFNFVDFEHINYPINKQTITINLSDMVYELTQEFSDDEMFTTSVMTILSLQEDFEVKLSNFNQQFKQIKDNPSSYLYINFTLNKDINLDKIDLINFYRTTMLLLQDLYNIDYLPKNVQLTFNVNNPDTFYIDSLFLNVRYIVEYIEKLHIISGKHLSGQDMDTYIQETYLPKGECYSSYLPIKELININPIENISIRRGEVQSVLDYIQSRYIMPSYLSQDGLQLMYYYYKGLEVATNKRTPSELMGINPSYITDEVFEITKREKIYSSVDYFLELDTGVHTNSIINILSTFFDNSTIMLNPEDILNFKHFLSTEPLNYTDIRVMPRHIIYVKKVLERGVQYV